jgi:hypothetical protein
MGLPLLDYFDEPLSRVVPLCFKRCYTMCPYRLNVPDVGNEIVCNVVPLVLLTM